VTVTTTSQTGDEILGYPGLLKIEHYRELNPRESRVIVIAVPFQSGLRSFGLATSRWCVTILTGARTMSRTVLFWRLVFFLTLSLASVPLAIAQKVSSPRPTTPAPIPDFSRVPEPTEQRVIFQQYDKTPLKFSSTTIYVLVPVVVTDKDGNHVSGLKKEDFQLQDNGKDQKVASVEEIKPTTAALTRLATPTNEITNQTSGDSAPRRLVIVALDMVNTPVLDQARARQAMIAYLTDNIELGCLYQLVVIENNGLHILHDYTQDTSTLVATLKTVRSHFATTNNVDTAALRGLSTDASPTTVPAMPISAVTGLPQPAAVMEFITGQSEQAYGQMRQADAANSTLLAFQQIAERASGIPGRKSLVWLTGSFPFSIDPSSASVNEGLSFAAYQHTMRLLESELISVYPVDAQGLLTTWPDASMHLSRKENAQAAAALADQSNRRLDTIQTMQAFADMTGGHAYVNTNDTRGAVRDAARDGAAYYMLSYPLDKSDRRPGWRRIEVKVGAYHVRARHGYFVTQTTMDPMNTAKYDIDNALRSPLDYTGLPLRMALNPPAPDGDKRKVTFAVMTPPKSTKIDSEDKNHLNVDIAYAVWTATGQDAAHKAATYNLNLNPAELQQISTKGLGYGDTLELAPGSYKLRLVVRDNLTGQIGSISSPLEVK
jgi:VWFA-related protein